ncbi:MAG: GyrI-like domain-containing protein [Maribacter sp.]|uniref:GyrI-like domain-containing protein n=1 Tax=Maribacter sp. TaxID=1897614 RepID=UPI0032994263
MKHEWRKSEKQLYLPKLKPEVLVIPEFQFLTISGEGNPNNKAFPAYISTLYAVSYAIKMTLKRSSPPKNYMDYTVYPLEGIWGINEEAIKTYDGTLNKDDLVFKLMIRQPEFVSNAFVQDMLELTKKKKPHPLLEQVKFQKIAEGKCVQMMHVGPFEKEQETFIVMEEFAKKNELNRLSKEHREIYLSDFRKVSPEKLKTVLRFQVNSK